MKLAFNGQAHYTDFSRGYEIYLRRERKEERQDEATYRRVVKAYCRILAERLVENGIVDLPGDMGSIAAAIITRKPQYRGKKFIGYGKMDWKKGHYDGKLKTFGMVYLPRRGKNKNLRSYGFVANRRLFKNMKDKYNSNDCRWMPIEFEEEMI